jgi:pyridoxal 5'-phosphate synthase pdxS subunit
MIRTKGEAGTGNVVEAMRHVRAVQGGIRQLMTMDEDEIYVFAKEVSVKLLDPLCVFRPSHISI